MSRYRVAKMVAKLRGTNVAEEFVRHKGKLELGMNGLLRETIQVDLSIEDIGKLSNNMAGRRYWRVGK